MYYQDEPKDTLMHYGMPRRSGRYPWGSGENPYQRTGDWLSRYDELRKNGYSEIEIAAQMGLLKPDGTGNIKQLRAQKTIMLDRNRSFLVSQAEALQRDGKNPTEIARIMGYPSESSVRSLLDQSKKARMEMAQKTADDLKELCDAQGKDGYFIDIGAGVDKALNIPSSKFDAAIEILQMEGYEVYTRSVPQATNPGQMTHIKVLCPPGTEYKDIYDNETKQIKVKSAVDYMHYNEDGEKVKPFQFPGSLDSKRLEIKYAEDGGTDKDGVIELRRGVQDLDLGNSHYAQVRIMVDGTHYLKGMAVYADDLPEGTDIRFNTNKPKGTPLEKVLKPLKTNADGTINQENPFGALIKENGGQYEYDGPDGKKHLGLINKTREEGDWNEWSKKLPSQFLSKQPMELINKQLNLSIADKEKEYADICALENKTLKKKMLETFASDCDSTAVHLDAAALPGQRYQVILPVTQLKDTECYAPNYPDGATLALIRYPHEGTFQIPIVTNNTKQPDARRIFTPTAKDMVGINKNVADRMSGADFDGDTVMVIPLSDKVRVSSTHPLKGLMGFDAKYEYPGYPGMKKMKNTQNEMGRISNLITDMTLQGASEDELARAVRHSMTVIDAEKHELDYKKSEYDNDISGLKRKYQKHTTDDGYGGASTLISRAKSETSVPKRVGSAQIDKETGKISYKTAKPEKLYYTDWNTKGYDIAKAGDKVPKNTKNVSEGQLYLNKRTGQIFQMRNNSWHEYTQLTDGKTKMRTTRSTKMAETDDAFSLISDAQTPQEVAYANYANKLKALANSARKEMKATGNIEYQKSSAATYKNEVDSLLAQVHLAEQNKPKERLAQTISNNIVAAQKKDNPGMTKEQTRKAAQQALQKARVQVGSKRHTITISDKEWEAIQAGALTETNVRKILDLADIDAVRERATPRNRMSPSSADLALMRTMKSSGYTTSEIADRVGFSETTILNYLG